MFRYTTFLLVFFVVSCSTDAVDFEETVAFEETLNEALASKEIVRDNVIACAASNADNDLISVFFYPRSGVTNVRYFETIDATVDKNDFENYSQLDAPISDVFNGFLKKYEIASEVEKWVIVVFDEAGKTHLSNPIRLKQNSKPTEYLSQNVSVDSSSLMPSFSWLDGTYDDTKIYFQVVSDEANNFLSGTYTFERNFQYYKLDNVVLNITIGTPPAIQSSEQYGFSLLAVSEDNWVNLFAEVPFEVAE